MKYHVILIEYGRPTHHWCFTDSEDAIIQLKRLNNAFQEVNEVFATIVKSGYDSDLLMPVQLLQNMICPPDRD